MNWNNGFSARYYAMIVDPYSWGDVSKFDITGGSISRTDSGLMESASIDDISTNLEQEHWIRIYLDARQAGQSTTTALFTGLATSPNREYDGRKKTVPLECYSVLKACEDVHLERGWYAPSGADGAVLAKTLLEKSTPAPVTINGISKRLSNHIISENNENCLSMAQKVLTAIGWRIRIHGDGTIELTGQATQASAKYDALENDAIEPQVSLSDDWYVCPNVFRASQGNTYAVARDDSKDSVLSTVNRGREVWAEETDVNLNRTESLGSYASRRLKELQRHAFKVSYTRRYNPDVLVGDLVNLSYPLQGIQGDYKVTNQSVTLSHGASTAEDVETIK